MAPALEQHAPTSPSRPLLAGSLRESTRIELEREVTLSFENLEGFMNEFSVNISTTGMFVRSREPRPAGTLLGFQLSLSDGQPLIRGHGEVVWVRRADEGPDRPAGMGIRFVDLDAESRRLIRWAVVRSCFQDDGRHLDLSELQATAAVEAAAELGQPAGAASSQLRRMYSFAGCASARPERRFRPRLRPLLPLAALVVGCLYLMPGFTGSAAVTPIEPAPTALAERAPEPAVAAPVAVPEKVMPVAETVPAGETAVPTVEPAAAETMPAAETVPLPETVPAARRQLVDVARAWARAWSDQRVDDYLGFYAAGFRPADGTSRGEWAAQRRVRILKPRHIEVALGSIVTEPMGSERAVVTFDQAYRSDSYRDRVRKTLELVRHDGGWKILAERVEG